MSEPTKNGTPVDDALQAEIHDALKDRQSNTKPKPTHDEEDAS